VILVVGMCQVVSCRCSQVYKYQGTLLMFYNINTNYIYQEKLSYAQFVQKLLQQLLHFGYSCIYSRLNSP
jgi:hypothetical protein